MPEIKITVLKRLANPDLFANYEGIDLEIPCPFFAEGQEFTVLRKMANQDLADEYCVPGATAPCPHFTEGQQFVLDSLAQPEGFCGWAWNDLHKFCVTLANGGEFGGYKKIVRCCTDGIRPVIFEVSLIDDE